jgi:hypothetical protein
MIDPGSRGVSRYAQLLIVAILIAIGINHIVFAIRDWPLGDMDVYLAAAGRLRDGEPLYLPGDVAVNSYWYAPWYAVAWVPLTYLPRDVIAVGWSAVLLAATAAVSATLWRFGRRGRVLALLVGPALFAVSAGGNVQSLMVLALLLGLHRPWGPVAVAAAATMKVAPILLVVAYLARGEWLRAGAAAALAALLLAPAIPMGIIGSGIRSDAAPSLLGISPVLYVVAVCVALGATFLVPRRHAVLAATTAAVLALPRLFVYDVTLVAVGAAEPSRPRDGQSGS